MLIWVFSGIFSLLTLDGVEFVYLHQCQIHDLKLKSYLLEHVIAGQAKRFMSGVNSSLGINCFYSKTSSWWTFTLSVKRSQAGNSLFPIKVTLLLMCHCTEHTVLTKRCFHCVTAGSGTRLPLMIYQSDNIFTRQKHTAFTESGRCSQRHLFHEQELSGI